MGLFCLVCLNPGALPGGLSNGRSDDLPESNGGKT
jgi:hypothetical protein